MGADVTVSGARELQEALSALTGALGASLEEELGARARMIAKGAAGRVPQRTGRAASSLGVERLDRGAMIVAGGSAAPWYPWVEHGAGPGRTPVRDGLYLYPAIRASLQDIEAAAAAAVIAAGRKAGVDVNG